MKQKIFTFILLQITMLFCATNVCAQAKEPYAVLNEDKTVLTFYYDELKSERNGMDVGPFSNETLMTDKSSPK